MMKKLDKLDYVKQAEEIINTGIKRNKFGKIELTTNKIRNMLTLVNELYNMVNGVKSDKLTENVQSHIQYVKMRLVYEAGRDAACKDFIIKSDILNHLDLIGDSKEKLLIVCHYMEALVAYHRFEDVK